MPQRFPTMKVVLFALLPVMLIAGIWLGGHARWLPDPVADALVGTEDRRVAVEALDRIHERYYRGVPYSSLSDAAIAGAVDDLGDRFSEYFSPQDYKAFRAAINNEFSGIGTAVRGVDDGLRVETVYPGSPAQKAGIRVGDVITKADGHPLAGLSEDAATALVKGPANSRVLLEIKRGRQMLRRRVTRARIEVPVVESRTERVGKVPVAYVKLSTFGPERAHEQVAAALQRAKKRGAKAIVFDLRGNGGGLVSEAQLIASMFLRGGPIVTTDGRSVPRRTLEATGEPLVPKLPMVVLTDRATASAAEIVAGALQDRDRAQLVGTRTYGKGVFQEILPLSNGGALDLTVGQYFLPSGRNLGGEGTKTGDGLKPDVSAPDDPDTPRDETLERALQVLDLEP